MASARNSAGGCCIQASMITTSVLRAVTVYLATAPEIVAGTCSDHRQRHQCVLDT